MATNGRHTLFIKFMYFTSFHLINLLSVKSKRVQIILYFCSKMSYPNKQSDADHGN